MKIDLKTVKVEVKREKGIYGIECWNATVTNNQAVLGFSCYDTEHHWACDSAMQGGLPIFQHGVGARSCAKKMATPELESLLNTEADKQVAKPAPYDEVAGIMRYEGGEMASEEEVIELLTALRNSGTLFHLQGSYQRLAAGMGVI